MPLNLGMSTRIMVKLDFHTLYRHYPRSFLGEIREQYDESRDPLGRTRVPCASRARSRIGRRKYQWVTSTRGHGNIGAAFWDTVETRSCLPRRAANQSRSSRRRVLARIQKIRSLGSGSWLQFSLQRYPDRGSRSSNSHQCGKGRRNERMKGTPSEKSRSKVHA